jgi:hypothetical protein
MNRVGVHYPYPAQDPVAEDTEHVPAGALTIGVEYRRLDAESLEATYAGTEFEAIFNQAEHDPTLALDGVSLHVCDAETGQEYVRFDCFDDDPHYHYMHPRVSGEPVDNHVIWFDAVAHGPILPWALQQIRTRLPEMLAEAGAPELATRVDSHLTAQAADRVGDIARQAAAQAQAASA